MENKKEHTSIILLLPVSITFFYFALISYCFLKNTVAPKKKNNYTVVITMLVAVYSEENKINILHGVNLRMNKLSL